MRKEFVAEATVFTQFALVLYFHMCIGSDIGSCMFIIFAHGCDITSMSLVGSPTAITHSLTHSILINL